MKKLILCSSLILLSACGKKNNESDVNGVITNPEHATVIDTVAYMFDNYYVHDKVGNSSAQIKKVNNAFAKDHFYNKIEEVFYQQKDYHTMFIKPSKCYLYGVLPKNLTFDIAEENGQKKIVVASLNTARNTIENSGSESTLNYLNSLAQLQVGDVITEINGVPALQVLENLAHISFGANKDAEQLSAVQFLLYKSGAIHDRPNIKEYNISIEREQKRITIPAKEFSKVDCESDEQGKSLLSDFSDEKRPKKPSLDFLKNAYNPMSEIDNVEIKDYYFETRENYAYLNIPTFSVDSEEDDKSKYQKNRILTEIDAKLSNAKIDTIVIDVRNNGGGSIRYADNLAKLFYDKNSKDPFYPMEFRLKKTKGNRELVDKFLAYDMYELENNESEYKLWQKDLEEAAQKGQTYTKPRAITQDFELNNTYSSNFTKANGKHIIVLTNAKCYSACDQFVAIMKDQNLATKIVGETKHTGGGGANVLPWNYLVKKKFAEKLPDNTNMSFAWREMQSRIKNGSAYRKIEGNGTQVDCVIPKTVAEIKEKTDSLNSNYIQKIIAAVQGNKCK